MNAGSKILNENSKALTTNHSKFQVGKP